MPTQPSPFGGRLKALIADPPQGLDPDLPATVLDPQVVLQSDGRTVPKGLW